MTAQFFIPLQAPEGYVATKAWKKRLKEHAEEDARSLALARMAPRAPSYSKGGHSSDLVYMLTANTGTAKPLGEAHRWAALVPNKKDRVTLKRYKLGIIPGLRSTVARQSKEWGQLEPEGAVQRELLQCPCGGGPQDAHHLFMACQYTEHVRQSVLETLRRAVDEHGSPRDKGYLADMTYEGRVLASLSSRALFSHAVEAAYKPAAASVWATGLSDVVASLKVENADLAAEATACVLGT